jgi:hypothetical protein
VYTTQEQPAPSDLANCLPATNQASTALQQFLNFFLEPKEKFQFSSTMSSSKATPIPTVLPAEDQMNVMAFEHELRPDPSTSLNDSKKAESSTQTDKKIEKENDKNTQPQNDKKIEKEVKTEQKEFSPQDIFDAAKITVSSDFSYVPPIRPPTAGDLQANVGATEVLLTSLIQWQNKKGTPGFVHQEIVKDSWTAKYSVAVQRFTGPAWDRRSPVLHSALAGLDTTNAGFDEAYIRALNALSSVMQPRRGEIGPMARNFIMRSTKQQYSPASLLLRGAITWAILGLISNGKDTMHPWQTTDSHQVATRIDDVEQFNSILVDTSKDGNDVIYTRLHTGEEAYIVDVMSALTSGDVPLASGRGFGLAQYWPPMNRPRVVYNSAASIGRPGGRISQASVWYAMERFCTIWDCHDLWRECLNFVQTMLLRPVDCGVVAGTKIVRMYWPESDLRVGAIGSLMAGVTPEGMKSVPCNEPGWKEFMYGAAVKGCMFTASTYEALRESHEAHPAALSMGVASQAIMNGLLYFRGNAQMMREQVGPRLEACGWGFMTTSLEAIGIGVSKKLLRNVLNSGAVPWWTVVAPHINIEKHDALSDWLRPAQITKYPKVNEWHMYDRAGAVSQSHIAAALWWMKVEVNYRVETRGAGLVRVKLPQLQTSRFPPVLSPEYKVGAMHATAILKFSHESYGQMGMLDDLGRADIHVIPILREDMWLPGTTTDGPDIGGGGDIDLLAALEDHERLLADPDFDRQNKPDPPPPRTEGTDYADELKKKIYALANRPDLSFFKADSVGDNKHLDTDTAALVHTLPVNVDNMYLFTYNLPGLLKKVQKDERLSVIRDLLEINRLFSAINQGAFVRKRIYDTRDRLIGIAQAFKQDPSLTIEEAGGAPDDIVEAEVKGRFQGQIARGWTFKQALEYAVAESQRLSPGIAPDEPEMEDIRIEDFGSGTSQQGSGEEPSPPVQSADVPSGQLPTVGFAPPGHSSASAKKPE